MSFPVFVVVHDDEAALRDVEAALRERYVHHYRIACRTSVDDACDLLHGLAGDRSDVAVVLCGLPVAAPSGRDLFDTARRLHPTARRAAMIAWEEQGDAALGEALFEAIASGRIDHYVLRPSPPPDEVFHNDISGLLIEWADAERTSPHTVVIVGESWSGRAYELRETLVRCALPHSFCLTDSEQGRQLVEQAGRESPLPLVVFPDGTILKNPSNADIARAAGSPVNPERMDFDLVIVGGGPAGLSAAVYGASEGFATLMVDEAGLGGQATYSSLIRNYLGFPGGVSGRRLAQHAHAQAWVFGAKFTFMQRVVGLQHDDGLAVVLAEDGPVSTRAVLLATGVSYRRIGIPELEALNGAGVSYGSVTSEAPGTVDRDVYIVGGANSAGQAALYLARYARRVTLIVRAGSLGAGMSHYLVQQVEATPNVEVRLETEIVGGGGDGHLERLVLRSRADGTEAVVDADALFVMIGAEPRTDWLPSTIRRDEHGFLLTGTEAASGSWPLSREPYLLETSVPGVFAAGDARRGSVKRVASAVGEGSIAIQLLHQFFDADELYPRGRPQEPLEVAAASGTGQRRTG